MSDDLGAAYAEGTSTVTSSSPVRQHLATRDGHAKILGFSLSKRHDIGNGGGMKRREPGRWNYTLPVLGYRCIHVSGAGTGFPPAQIIIQLDQEEFGHEAANAIARIKRADLEGSALYF